MRMATTTSVRMHMPLSSDWEKKKSKKSNSELKTQSTVESNGSDCVQQKSRSSNTNV